MTDFLIKSSIFLLVLHGFYHLVLQKEKMHRFNRFYLLASIVISLVLPFITFEIIKIIPVSEEIIPITEMPISFEAAPEKTDYTPFILWSLYGLITTILLFRFGKNIWKLISKSKENPTVNYKNSKLVLVDENTLPHTFLNCIYINFEDYNQRNIEDELYTHELVHVTQKHTLDILFIEFLKTVFWFNPIFILYKKAIQLNHEFLADEEVVESYNNVPFYQSLLLQKGNANQTIYLASNLNYLVTKKRLIMMTKNTSKTIALVKKMAVAPIIAGLIYFFCIEVVAQEKVISNPKDNKTQAEKDKIRDSYYSNVRIMLKDKRNNTSINKMYEELTLEERRKYMSWVPDMIIEKEVPEPLFKKLSTKDNAVWINNKVSSKEQVRKHKRSDFVYYTYSFVHKNARTKRFPQEYQYTLFTKAFFDKNMKNSHLHFSNDTLKLIVSDYVEPKNKKVNDIIAPKVDTLVWYNHPKDGDDIEYNLYVRDTEKKKPSEQKQGNEMEQIGDKYVNEKGSFDAKGNFLKDGYIKINNKTYMYVTNKENEIEYFTRWGDRVDKKGEPLTSNGNAQEIPKNTSELTEKPEYEGGLMAFYKYISANYKLSEEGNKAKLKGRVFMSFVIEKDGSLSDIKVLKDLGYGTGEEAERVLKDCPKWKPGKIDGKPVRTSYSLPINVIWD